MVHEVHRNPNQIDDPFRSANVAKEFFRRKDRSRSYEMQDVIGVRLVRYKLMISSNQLKYLKGLFLGIHLEHHLLVDLTTA